MTVYRLFTFSPVAQFRFGNMGTTEVGKLQKLIQESQNLNGDWQEGMITERRATDVSAEELFKNVESIWKNRRYIHQEKVRIWQLTGHI